METDNLLLRAMYRRWIYMAIAIIAAAVMPLKPALSFQEDKGIIYVRSFSMDEQTVTVTQTDIKTGMQDITGIVSVKGLYYCHKVMFWGCVLCLLCFFSKQWRIIIALLTAISAGVYYVLIAYYAIHIADVQYATLYPNYMAAFPAVVLQMMVLTRHNVIGTIVIMDDISGV